MPHHKPRRSRGAKRTAAAEIQQNVRRRRFDRAAGRDARSAVGFREGTLAAFAQYMREFVTRAAGGGYHGPDLAVCSAEPLPRFRGFWPDGATRWETETETHAEGAARYHGRIARESARLADSPEFLPVAWVRHWIEGGRMDLHHCGYGDGRPAYALVRLPFAGGDGSRNHDDDDVELRHYHAAGGRVDAFGFRYAQVWQARLIRGELPPLQAEMLALVASIRAATDPAGVGAQILADGGTLAPTPAETLAGV